IVHIGLVQGTAFTPWILLAVEQMIAATDRRRMTWAVALFACASALTVLAGDPRAATSATIIVGIWTVARLIHGIARPRSLIALIVSASALGIALSAIQWVPGIGFLHSSQRATAAYSFFSGGSFDLRSLASNLLVPFLIGGNGDFGLPVYTGSYNLPEVTVGAGLVALVAAGAYLPTLARSAMTWITDRTTIPGHQLGTAYALTVVGALLALGSDTPLGNVLVHIPLYGGERLQNRNAVIFDVGLTMLVAFFVDDMIKRPRAAERSASARRRLPVLGSWPSIVAGAIAPAGAAALIVIAYAFPIGTEARLGVQGVRPALFRALQPYLTPSLVFALVLVGFVVVARLLAPNLRASLCVLFVAVDILSYLLSMGLVGVPTSAVASTSPLSTQVIALAGPNGRFALYNAAYETFGTDPLAAVRVGVTDVNLLRNEPSVQGYGSIVNSGYENATSTHAFEDLAIGKLSSKTFDILNLSLLLAPPGYLDVALATGQQPPIALDHGSFSTGTNVAPPPPGASGPYPIATSQPATFFLSSPRHIQRVTIYLNTANGGPRSLRVTALGPSNQGVVRMASVIHNRVVVKFPAAMIASQFDVTEPDGLPGEIGAVLAVTRLPGERLLLDGALQNQLAPPHWTFAGLLDGLTAFTNHSARGPAWLETTSGVRSDALGTVRTVSITPTDPTVMTVDAPHGAVLVRSEEYSHGWTARLHPIGGGPTIVLPVAKDGLIQKVSIPPGKYTVTWRYAPLGVLVGLILTALGVAILLALLVVSRPRRRGRTAPTA
ncbi:MAG TPA: hypothetical protein VG368_01560, partial [Acidimicrobiales bacterium]|nr:hypothetical protein [Acidimicrobiales bacterium]